MAATKSNTVIHDDITLTASAGDTTSSTVNIATVYQATVRIRITNGATGPTIAAQTKIQIAEADTAAKFVTLVICKGTTTNSDVQEYIVPIPDTAAYLRLVSGSNTGQNVTLRAVIDTETAI